MSTHYYAAFIPSNAGYAVFVPDFPEVASQGADVSECIDMAHDALSLAIKAYAKANKPMPVPSDIDIAQRKVAYELATLGVDLPEGAIWQHIQVHSLEKYPQKIPTPRYDYNSRVYTHEKTYA